MAFRNKACGVPQNVTVAMMPEAFELFTHVRALVSSKMQMNTVGILLHSREYYLCASSKGPKLNTARNIKSD